MCKMTPGLRECDGFDGASNFVPWKLRLQMLMEEANLWEHVLKVVLVHVNPTQVTAHYKKKAKAKIIILDLMKDHFIPRIAEKMTGKDMFEALVCLFQSSCVS